MPQTLKLAVCICDKVTLSDFVTPCEILTGINDADRQMFASDYGDVPYRLEFDYLAPTIDPVVPLSPGAPKVVPTRTYEDALKEGIQYDILWVPAGPIPVSLTPQSEIDFIKAQAPKSKYIASVCTGSGILAEAGVLSGKKATTNKLFYRRIVEATPKDINWVPKARWVVDGNIWTSSGVTAGTDMALAFLEHLAGPRMAEVIRGTSEVIEHGSDEDPFAAHFGLV